MVKSLKKSTIAAGAGTDTLILGATTHMDTAAEAARCDTARRRAAPLWRRAFRRVPRAATLARPIASGGGWSDGCDIVRSHTLLRRRRHWQGAVRYGPPTL